MAGESGARDWNRLHAWLAKAAPKSFRLHDAVQGQYLGQAFTGRIVALTAPAGDQDVAIRLNRPIDTVRFDSFSNLRRQIQSIIGADGRSTARTSDGVPQLIVERAQMRPRPR